MSPKGSNKPKRQFLSLVKRQMLNSGANHPTGTIGFDFKEKRRKRLDEKNLNRNGFCEREDYGEERKMCTSEMGNLV